LSKRDSEPYKRKKTPRKGKKRTVRRREMEPALTMPSPEAKLEDLLLSAKAQLETPHNSPLMTSLLRGTTLTQTLAVF